MAPTETPAAEEAVKGAQNGLLPIGSVKDILDRAPSDLVEEVLEIPEWNCSVKVRSLTAAQSASVKQRGFGFKGEETQVAWAEMEIVQFQQGVVEPRFSEDEARKLHLRSGRGFQRVIAWLDAKSGMDKEELRKAREEFQGSQE